jgi:hypothetical protein
MAPETSGNGRPLICVGGFKTAGASAEPGGCNRVTQRRRAVIPSGAPPISKCERQSGVAGMRARRRKHWLEGLEFGLPDDFDFTVVKTKDDAASLMFRLPNADRGQAGRGLFDHRQTVGSDVAFSGLMDLWDHDHGQVAGAFGCVEYFLDALRIVAPPTRRKRPLRVWRGVDCVAGIAGPSWTTNRDVACWFAMRYAPVTPLVATCVLLPDDVIAEHNGRGESEVITSPIWVWDCIVLDNPFSKTEQAVAEFEYKPPVVSARLLANWRAGHKRCAKQIKKANDLSFRRALARGRARAKSNRKVATDAEAQAQLQCGE